MALQRHWKPFYSFSSKRIFNKQQKKKEKLYQLKKKNLRQIVMDKLVEGATSSIKTSSSKGNYIAFSFTRTSPEKNVKSKTK